MDNKKMTKKVLAEVAGDLSKVMDFETPIKTGDEVTKKDIIADLIEAAGELEAKDKISDLSREVLAFLKLELPVAEGGEAEEPEVAKEPEVVKAAEKAKKDKPVKTDNGKKDKPVKPVKTDNGKKAAEPKPPKKEGKKVAKYTQVQAFCDAVKKGSKTLDELIEDAKKLYNAANPGKEKTKLSYIPNYIKVLVTLGFIELKDKKYFLK